MNEHKSLEEFSSSAPRVRLLRRVIAGELTLAFPNGRRFGLVGEKPGPNVTLEINRYRALWRALSGGELGLAESFMEGDWSASDLVGLMESALTTKAKFDSFVKLYAFVDFINRRRSNRRPNTRAGSAANIAYHYDLGNAFYAEWLDETMTYSSALFTKPDLSLAAAQDAKYRRVAKSLGLAPGDRVLEIGCGWGGFAEFATREIGCRVTGLTLSKEQARFARERLQRAQLNDLTDIRIEDYRDVQGSYDKIVSIEMFEAVGEEYWPHYFQVVRERLAPGGRASLQVITVAEKLFERYRRRIDFIQRYIFPGGVLPSQKAFAEAVGKAGLEIKDSFFFGASYAETLRQWRARFEAKWSGIAQQGFDERFRRMWTYYLCYCEAGFRKELVDVGQFLIARR
jgi:cyclopropane-fatty-acyl-phospholipid synthase